MSKKAVKNETLTNIAEAIRRKTGDTALMKVADMPAQVAAIPDSIAFTPDLTAFSDYAPMINAAFTGWASDAEKNLWYMLFKAVTTRAGVIDGLATNFELDMTDITVSSSLDNVKNLVRAVASGVTLTISNYVEYYGADTAVLSSLVESVIAGNLTFKNAYVAGQNITLSKSTSKWCSKLSLIGLQHDGANINLGGSAFDEFVASGFTSSRVGVIASFVSDAHTVKKISIKDSGNYSLESIAQPTIATALEELDIDFDKVNIASLKNAFKNTSAITGLPTDITIVYPYEFREMGGAFENCSWITSLTLKNYSSNGLNAERAFYGCVNLTACNIAKSFNIIGSDNSLNYMFYGCSKLQSFDLQPYFYSGASIKSITNMFNNCSVLTSVTLKIRLAATDISNLFSGCPKMQTIILQLTEADGSNKKITTWTDCFDDYANGELVKLDFSTLDFSNITKFSDAGLWVDRPDKGYRCFLEAVNSVCEVIWPDEITFTALQSTEEWAFIDCRAGVGSNFVKNCVSSNKALTIYLPATEYAKLTSAEIENFNTNCGTVNSI